MEQMKPAPPKMAEAIVGLFLPQACRENVLGDLYERYTGKWQYAVDAARTVPLVIASRIHRTSDPQIVLIEAFTMYLAYLAAAWYIDRSFLDELRGLTRLAIPAAITLAVLVLWDVYSHPSARSLKKPILCTACGAGFALIFQALPFWIVICGAAMGALLVSSLRMMLPPDAPGQPHTAVSPWPISPRLLAIAALLWVIYRFRK
jgi:hypothetical protein